MSGPDVHAALLARRVRDAVDATERCICGEDAVTSAAVAEGLALAGRRAARRIGTGREPFHAAPVDAPWVDHRVGRTTGDGAAFEPERAYGSYLRIAADD